MIFQPAPGIRRYAGNPILTPRDIPYPSVQTYNAGFTKFQGKYVMVFRNDYQRTEADWRAAREEAERTGAPFKYPRNVRINLGLAFSDDGYRWEVRPEPCLAIETDEIERIYDPRLTVLDGRCYLCFAVDTRHGVRGGIAVTDDFSRFEILSMTVPDNRNMVLFPEKIGGKFMRLERPFPVYSRNTSEAFDIWSSMSPDCRYWGDSQLVLGAEKVPFCNSKIGPAAPPVKTPKGWLTTIHAVWKTEEELFAWHPDWKKVYYGGIMLLDLDDPTRVIGLCRQPILAPETDFEVYGMRGSVIFPGGMILEDSGEVKIYYGAADTVEAVATADVDDLIRLCLESPLP
jgi:beta-1,4-mannooligosaccharide/beta-1,4-mannosyl-N-acetylglucosamine phosphorylase